MIKIICNFQIEQCKRQNMFPAVQIIIEIQENDSQCNSYVVYKI